MKKFLLFLLLQLVFSFGAKACLNYFYSLDKNGNLHYIGEMSSLPHAFNKNFNKELIVSKIKKLNMQMEKDHSIMALSDYAVDLLKLGKVNEALDIFVELYSNSPNEYKLASNLGTAYELHGDVDSALKYICRGIELNPNDHDGSEWIHVKILETKKKIATNPKWLDTHSVLELSEMQKRDSTVRNQLFIQLQERFPFVPGPDAMMASLFEDLGDISANTNSIEYAKVFYNIAREYYGSKSDKLENKIREMEKLLGKYASVRPPEDRLIEGDNAMLGFMSYKTLVEDNDTKHYQVDWTKLISDPKTLLAKVNITMRMKMAGNNPVVSSDSSSVKEFSESDPATEKKKDPNRLGNLIWGITAFLILAGGVVALGRKRKWKRPKD
jgi:tetratricopeptide (TPR) repeat protein